MGREEGREGGGGGRKGGMEGEREGGKMKESTKPSSRHTLRVLVVGCKYNKHATSTLNRLRKSTEIKDNRLSNNRANSSKRADPVERVRVFRFKLLQHIEEIMVRRSVRKSHMDCSDSNKLVLALG